MTPEALLLTLLLTLLPGHDPESARALARDVMTRAGCAESRVEMDRASTRRAPLTVKAWCTRLNGQATPKEGALP